MIEKLRELWVETLFPPNALIPMLTTLVVLALTTGVVFSLTQSSYGYNQTFREGIMVESHGLLFDLLV